MDSADYKLNCTLVGHTGDVRAIAFFEDGTLVSASRDKTARVWRPSRDGREYTTTEILKGHKNFVSSVCVLHPSPKNPRSLIITGSNDKRIRIYVLGDDSPTQTITAHEDTVCNLRTGHEDGTYLSSSWDLSAKLWGLDNPEEPRLILHGHSLSVWCVADLKSGLIVTGSADKLVIVWSRDGTALHKLEGHTDCVRDIAVVKDDEFLTCANDTTVRHWSALSGECLGTYCGHENFVYAISALPSGAMVATGGEDRSVRVWKNGENCQTIVVPATSVWCVKILSNGDIAAGSSDGHVRVFSADPDRHASPEVLESWEKIVAEDQAQSKLALNDQIKINELPDAAALTVPGKKDGQTLMIKEEGKGVAYSWSASQQTWVRIGEVIGAAGGNSSKTTYNGVEYDYVFSVDIQDGVPPLKLPYNKTEDPWQAAQKFIHQHGLSQMFLDQVANFIVKNSDSTPALQPSSSYADPFTGGSRYIPGSGLPNTPQPTASVPNPDPFTGITASSSSLPDAPPSASVYIPHRSYLKLEQANAAAILDKLKEFNSKIVNTDKLPEETLQTVVNLINKDSSDESTEGITALWKILGDWPPEFSFPALDVARLAVLHPYSNRHICSETLFPIVHRHTSSEAVAANQMLTFRLLANMFTQEAGEQFGLNYSDDFLNLLVNLASFGSKNNQVAISTYILNLSIALNKRDDVQRKIRALSVIMTILPKFKEIEAIFRALVALGTLIAGTSHSNNQRQLIHAVKSSDSTVNSLQTMAQSKSMHDPHGKVAKCSTEILALIV
ncbi:phospholipase A-2-activating protein [Diachasma alloeum]|uniref:phospholipase A-2-activating protein n=1 Tax=Diachasma alloeum TaxID=454923 RepID=UPI00073810D5|nr:phospholipase A-2-activating protein [Diachasma alloeum]